MSNHSPEWSAAGAFVRTGRISGLRPLGRGLINDTFLVSLEGADAGHFVLQRINRRVFTEPERIMENLRTLGAHLHARRGGPAGRALRLPEIRPARDGRDFHLDAAGEFWRALEYLAPSRVFESLDDPARAGEVGGALGRFHALTHALDARRLHVTRRHFHDTPHFYARFLQAAARPRPASTPRLAECLDFARARAPGVGALEDARRAGRLAMRVVHGDPKLDNVLFDEAGERAVGLVDLDTVQPGLIHCDLGDCLRSSCNPAGESPSDPAQARFDPALARAILAGWFAETRGLYPAEELAYLPAAIRLIPFELGLRFLADYLSGNVYFKVAGPEHNLLRAATQFRLVADIERREPEIAALVAELAAR